MKKLGICILSLLCAGIFCLTALAAAPGDVDGSGEVTVDDARLALRAAVGLETYPVGSGAFAAAYEQALTDAGFTLTRKSILGAYTYTNEKTGVTVTYADSRRLNGTLRSVTLQIL